MNEPYFNCLHVNPYKEETLNEVVSEEEKRRVYGCILNMFLIKDE